MLGDGRLRLDHLITHVAPATAAPAVFAMMERGPKRPGGVGSYFLRQR